jgi:hypothetical protein
MPELSQALTAQGVTGDVKVVVRRNTGVTVKAGPHTLNLSPARDPNTALSSPPDTQAGASEMNASGGIMGALIDNSPITPETGRSWKISLALLALLISAALVYVLLLHR